MRVGVQRIRQAPSNKPSPKGDGEEKKMQWQFAEITISGLGVGGICALVNHSH